LFVVCPEFRRQSERGIGNLCDTTADTNSHIMPGPANLQATMPVKMGQHVFYLDPAVKVKV